MTDKEVKDFVWEWKRNWFDTDSYVKRFFWKNWNTTDFLERTQVLGIWTAGIDAAIRDGLKNPR